MTWRRFARWLIVFEIMQLIIGASVGTFIPWHHFLTSTGAYAQHE